jgi:UDP-N-acetylmuramoyl-tripeptide--D-alanyl-D-alanine ligase
MFSGRDLRKALQSQLISWTATEDFFLENVTFDSREAEDNSLFVALKGEHQDGHNFIRSLLADNPRAMVLAEYLPSNVTPDSRVILVQNTRKALESLAIFARQRLTGKVLGVTGSIGKTTTKDILFQVLTRFGKSFCSPWNFNTWLGLVTTLFDTPSDVDFLIGELGINQIGEMASLANLLQPEIAILLNVKPSHLEYLVTEETVALEKMQIVTSATKLLLLRRDDTWYDFIFSRITCPCWTFGLHPTADIYLEEYVLEQSFAQVKYRVVNQYLFLKLKNLDYSFAINIMPALAVLQYFQLPLDGIQEILETLTVLPGRNNVEYISYEERGQRVHVTLIDGSYNAVVPDTFINGLHLLNNLWRQGKFSRRVCIWGDMLEIGIRSEEFHLSLGPAVVHYQIDLLLTVGKQMQLLGESLRNNSLGWKHFSSVEELVMEVKDILQDGDLVFIKSSNSLETHKVVNFLSTGFI